MGSTWKTFDVSPRRGRSGPIIFEHVGKRVPPKKVATSLAFHFEKVLHFGSMWGVALREKMCVDQLERGGFKNTHF